MLLTRWWRKKGGDDMLGLRDKRQVVHCLAIVQDAKTGAVIMQTTIDANTMAEAKSIAESWGLAHGFVPGQVGLRRLKSS
jgi:hypothetical protein